MQPRRLAGGTSVPRRPRCRTARAGRGPGRCRLAAVPARSASNTPRTAPHRADHAVRHAPAAPARTTRTQGTSCPQSRAPPNSRPGEVEQSFPRRRGRLARRKPTDHGQPGGCATRRVRGRSRWLRHSVVDQLRPPSQPRLHSRHRLQCRLADHNDGVSEVQRRHQQRPDEPVGLGLGFVKMIDRRCPGEPSGQKPPGQRDGVDDHHGRLEPSDQGRDARQRSDGLGGHDGQRLQASRFPCAAPETGRTSTSPPASAMRGTRSPSVGRATITRQPSSTSPRRSAASADRRRRHPAKD